MVLGILDICGNLSFQKHSNWSHLFTLNTGLLFVYAHNLVTGILMLELTYTLIDESFTLNYEVNY